MCGHFRCCTVPNISRYVCIVANAWVCSGIWCCTVPNTGDFSRHGCVVAFGVAQSPTLVTLVGMGV